MKRPDSLCFSVWLLASALFATPGHADGPIDPATTAGTPQFIPRDAVQHASQNNLQLTSVLVAGGPPYPGSTFTVLREEPTAFGKFRRKVMAVSGPQAHAGFTLSPGRYLVGVRNGIVSAEVAVDVPEVGTAYREVVLDAGNLELSSLMDADGEPAEQTWFRIYREVRDAYGKPTRMQVAGNGYASNTRFLLPAGEYLAEAMYGNTRRQQRLAVTAGTTASHQFILDAAMLELSAVLSGDGEPAEGARFSVHRRQIGEDGREHWTEFTAAEDAPRITFVLPAGEYLAQATLGRAQTGTSLVLTAGEPRSVELHLDAGEVTLFATLPGPGGDETLLDSWFWLHEIGGEDAPGRRAAAPAQGPLAKATFVVPAGRYEAIVKSGESLGSAIVEVEAGGQQVLSVPVDGARVTLQLQTSGHPTPLEHTWFSVYRVERDRGGSPQRRRVFNAGYYPQTELILPAGEYVAFARAGERRGEISFSVVRGEHRELVIAAEP